MQNIYYDLHIHFEKQKLDVLNNCSKVLWTKEKKLVHFNPGNCPRKQNNNHLTR